MAGCRGFVKHCLVNVHGSAGREGNIKSGLLEVADWDCCNGLEEAVVLQIKFCVVCRASYVDVANRDKNNSLIFITSW